MLRYLQARFYDLTIGRCWQFSLEHQKWRRWTGSGWEWREATSEEQEEAYAWWAIR